MKRAIFALMITMMAGAALAQDVPSMPRGRWWQMPQVVKQLGITAEQQGKLDAIFQASQTDLIDLKADVDKQGVELRAMLEKPQTSRKDVLATASKLSASRGKLFEREITMLFDMRAVLSEQQWSALRMAMEERRSAAQRERGDRPRPPKP